MSSLLSKLGSRINNVQTRKNEAIKHPFWIIVQKEIADHVRSWRFVILLAIICLTCLASLYTSIMKIRDSVATGNPIEGFFFLQLFTLSDGTLPSFITFVSFLGPLLGIGLGFDAINTERNKGTLSRIMSQPIHRDYLLNAKFVAALSVVGLMFLALTMLVIGIGILLLGIPPTPDEFMRVLLFFVVTLFYVGFWLNLSIIFSVRFRQPATSALSGIAIWLFFTVFYSMIVNLIARAIAPAQTATFEELLSFQNLVSLLIRISPGELFSEATTTLLMPTVQTLNPFAVTQAQLFLYIPTPLSVGQSLILVWPHITSLACATLICFAISYVMFMRQEIRSR